MAQRTTISAAKEAKAPNVDNSPVVETPAEENSADPTAPTCCHHWAIQPADGPVSNGSCQVCGETREFKNYVESATWGDNRTTRKGSSTSAVVESSSDDEDTNDQNRIDEETEPDMDLSDSKTETND